jgi:dTDP-glucose 4,6-dehydratase
MFIKTDILGTFNILELARIYNLPRIIHISTDEVYGSIKKGSFAEDAKLDPTSPYSASKSSADMLIKSYIKTYNLPAIIVRPTNNYGPYQFPEKLIPLMITNAIENKFLPVYGGGKNVRDWLYVLDTAEAIDIILHKGKSGEIYNVSSKNELQNIVVVKKILKLLNKPESLIKFVKDRLAHDFRYSVDPTKIYKLGFVPKYNFDLGIKYTVKWYQENIYWWKKIKLKKEFKDFYNKHYK